MDTNTTFQQYVRDRIDAAGDAPFQPVARYDPDGDCVEFFARPGMLYAQRVDELVTVYYSREDGQLAGSIIKNFKRFIERNPLFQITIRDGRVRLDHFFVARIISSHGKVPPAVSLTYQKLVDVAKETGIEAELSPA